MAKVKGELIILGDGILGNALLFELSLFSEPLFSKVIQIGHPQLARPCTLDSTSYISHHGIQKGVSPLGDLLFDSYETAVSFLDQWEPPGVVRANHFLAYKEGAQGRHSLEELERRFGKLDDFELPVGDFEIKGVGKVWPGYLIHAPTLVDWLKFKVRDNFQKKNVPFEEKKALITGIEEDNGVVLNSSTRSTFKADTLVLCTGAQGKLLAPFLPEESQLAQTKSVPGTYGIKENVLLDSPSFAVTLNGENLIYRKERKQLLLGGTSLKQENVFLPEQFNFEKMSLMFKEYFKGTELEKYLESPFELKVGNRHKGKKRTPFWGSISKNDSTKIFGFYGAYKNGFSVAFHGAKDLVKKLNESII